MKRRSHSLTAAGFAVAFVLAGCQTRSISDYGLLTGNRLYAGEIEETSVIGLDHGEPRSTESPSLRRGSRVMLVQSGALFPDAELVESFSDDFEVTTFSGVPPSDERAANAPSLRSIAARGGIDSVVCVWGIIESLQRDRATRVVSWVPILGWGISDQDLDTRLRLRFVVVDVVSGSWRAWESKPVDDTIATSPFTRDLQAGPGRAGAAQAVRLKQQAFRDAVPEFLAKYLGPEPPR